LHHAFSNRWDRNRADLAALLGNLSSTIRPRVVPVRAQLYGELRERLASTLCLNRLECLVVGPGGSAIAFGLQGRRFERVEFLDVDVQSPKRCAGADSARSSTPTLASSYSMSCMRLRRQDHRGSPYSESSCSY
jgi:hypothetical protein